ncbi:trypsin-like peptidase domain-containing protein [Antarctobacter heliothermus]|uniref:WD40 repeat n=1 Tax=Antarctobacter heliothermus TaxID=74033 RepID=A0A239H9N3_9RHOB|nr:trypsin-like peptidase domain-containing protein [Antarctobacter heliothermus]SNS77871.1 WD40 repeat [Antarctobacter heliothermus]
MTWVRRLLGPRFGLGLLCVLALGGAASGQGLPVFDGSEFDRLVMEAPARVVARNRARIKDSVAKPIIRYTQATVARQAARGVGQLRLQITSDSGPFVVTCTGFLVAPTLILTAHRCGPGVLDDPALATRKPVSIARMDFIAGYDAPRETDQGTRLPVEVTPVEADAESGYAVLRLKGVVGTALPLSKDASPSTGTPLMILTHPFGESLFVVRDGCALRGSDEPGGRLSHGCATLPGSAGAPVLDMQGRVIAMHLEDRGQGGRGVLSAHLIAQSRLLWALSEGETCVGASAERCGLPPSAGDPKAALATPNPMAASPDPTADPDPDQRDTGSVEAKDDPTAAFPVGIGDAGPAIYGIALPYLPPGTGVELVTGPVGDLTGPKAVLIAGTTDYAATVTRLEGRHAALSLWRGTEGTLAARRYIGSGAEGIALSPDGRRLAVVRQNGAVGARLVEVFTLPTLGPLFSVALNEDGPASALAFSPDGTWLAVAQSGKVSAVSGLRGETGERQWRMATDEPVSALMYSSDGGTLAFAITGSVAVHVAETGAYLRGMEPAGDAPAAISGLAFTRDGSGLIAGAADTFGLHWQLDSGTLTGRIGPAMGGRLLGVSAAGDAAVFVSKSGGGVQVFDLDGGGLRRGLDAHEFTDVALTPDGIRLMGLVGGAAPGLILADPVNGVAHSVLKRDGEFVSALAFSPDSTRLALAGSGWSGGSAEQQLQIWSWQDGQVTFASDGYGPKGPVAMAWRSDGSALAVQGAGVALRLHDFAAEVMSRELGDASDAVSLAFGENGASLIRVSKEGLVALLDVRSGALRRSWPGDFAALSPNGTELAIGRNAPTPEIILVDPSTGTERLALEMPFARIGPLAYRGEDAEILGLVQPLDTPDIWILALWSAEDGRLLRRFGELDGAPRTMAVSPDGRFVAVAEDGAAHVLLWDIAVDRFLWRLETGAAEVRALAFAPDGLRIAAGLAPAGVVLWDMIDGQVKARLAPFAEGTLAQVGATLFLSDPALLDRVAVRLPDGMLMPALQILRDGLPDFVPTDLPLAEQVTDLLDRLRAGEADARLLLVEGRGLAFDLEFRREVQRQLKSAEFYSGAIDGDIGRGSLRALELFAAGE